ncbi:IclR family transcriptional regulator [Streptomyces sp. NPDC005820]|uniref:IclR family transcriptional regulator n=1 Tax=Streptomyces sp. NPDC005820 TaxID=3157069 RepID=UPI0033C95219
MSSRLLDVLFAFRPGRSRLTLADLTRETGLPHATVRRLALELVEAGALERAADGGFTVGIRLWQLGTLAPLSVPLRTAALPFMDDLHTALRQHVQLAVLEGTEAVLVERLSAGNAVDVMSKIGGRLPLHCSGVGKVLLAHAGPELIGQVITRGLSAYTERTVTDPARLLEQLDECRETGVAVVRQETTPGADSVATRVLDAEGRVVAALSVVVSAGSVDLRTVRPAVIASGLAVSRRLGWHPSAGVEQARMHGPGDRLVRDLPAGTPVVRTTGR